MSADIDINDRVWITIRANGSLELNTLHRGDIVETVLDPRKTEDREGLELLKGAIEHCLFVSKPTTKEEN
jgi:hypothetical protein